MSGAGAVGPSWCWVALAVLGCDAARGPAPEPGTVDEVAVALQEGPTIAFDVGISATYCAATVRCEPELLVDPFTGRRTTTLVLAHACRDDADDGTLLDVFHAIQRRMTCYDGGVPEDPRTWQPAGGHVVVPLREEIYAGLVSPWGDTQYNLAVLPLDVVGHAFCRYEAWGVFDAAQATGERAVRHLPGGTVVRWDVYLTGDAPGAIDCHLDEAGASVLQIGNAIHVTHTRATPVEPGAYPRRQSFALSAAALHRMRVGDSERQVHGLQVAYGIDADFPPARDAPAGALWTRDLWLADEDGVPIDVAGAQSCTLLDEAGDLEAIAVEIVDWWTRVPLGALVLHDALADERFACEVDAQTGACRLWRGDDVASEAPCLVR